MTLSNTPIFPFGPMIRFKRLHADVVMPRRAYDAIGWDLAAFLISETNRIQQTVLPPRSSKIVPTGLILLPPPGYYITICSRSGHAAANPPVFVANAPGIIDPDFTGELKVILYNGGYDSVNIKHGDYIAQLVLAVVPPIVGFAEITETPTTERGDSGIGSTDKPTPT